MAAHYTDPDGGTVEEIITWEIEQGYQGKWSACKDYEDEGEARAWMRKRSAACPMENLRLVRVETTIVRTIEDQINAST